MKQELTRRSKLLLAPLVLFFIALACQKETTHSEKQDNNAGLSGKDVGSLSNKAIKAGNEATVTVFATGLNNPRGLKFGPDGNLYVAEGGTGGTNSTSCTQVVPPVGPYLGSETGGRISKINSAGVRTTVTSSLPSSQTSALIGSLVSGVGDVEFIGNTLYAILAGAGCSHGVQSLPNGIVKVNPDGTSQLIADLSAWQQAHPVKNPEEDDFEPDGTWYSVLNVRGDLYAVEPNHGEIVKVTTNGDISRVIDISASQGHIVPTSIAYHGNFFVGNLGVFPVIAGSSNIYKITPSGEIKVWATGFTTVVGVAFDDKERMYVLENSSISGEGPTPGTGRIVRVSQSGTKEVIASGLSLPTAMTFGPDGKIYVSNWGFGPPLGQILQIDFTN